MKVSEGIKLNITKVFLMLELPEILYSSDLATSRYDDKEVSFFFFPMRI